MSLKKTEFNQLIHKADFKTLFNKMGWNQASGTVKIKIGEHQHVVEKLAEKSAFFIALCSPAANGNMPLSADRRKIDTKYRSTASEHLLIYHDEAKRNFCWQFVIRRPNQPNQVAEVPYEIDPGNPQQEFEQLYQRAKGIAFNLDQENGITIFKVVDQVQANFGANAEKVTKKFYDGFKKQHTQFKEFIDGIGNVLDKEWYTSIMLNRLMFCYFIQKKEFLDKDIHYLRNKLKASQEKRGQDQFYGFYRHFLLTLFHEGLNNGNQDKAIKDEIGRIPYLNGGLFDVHELEEKYKDKIQIPDKAFDSLFTFFDEWTWHLDTRPGASEKEINPDVIGYIFEKYINERAKMGAYYTKEDITEYISKNCIIPFLFEETRRNSTHRDFDVYFTQVLAGTGDRYIYDAVKKGIPPFESLAGNEDKILRSELPADVQAGLEAPDETLVESRKCWKRPAPDGIALPTEIYRELIERRKRYLELRQKIENGEITSITDFITYNLNIRQFAQDFLYNCDDPAVLRSFFKALTKVSILDPTCGSGAFLFAALNILEPLYETCLDRMQALVSDEDLQNLEDKSTHRNRFKDFRAILELILNEQHTNRTYFIYKSIILNNLYGVDIMKEAVEIAKLRLFLKLVSTASADFTAKGAGKNYGLEPLPDIDFNIRCGNALVGFATEEELIKGLKWQINLGGEQEKIEEKCEVVSKAYSEYKRIQLAENVDFNDFKEAKVLLGTRLKELNLDLNKLMHKSAAALKYDKWLADYQPFHWFAEFYDIVKVRGGFDVVIGNPPYVEYKDVKEKYVVKDFHSLPSSDLYAFVLERGVALKSINSGVGFIIPLSCFTVDGFESIQNLYFKAFHTLHISNWSGDAHPSKLFEGVDKRLHILMGSNNKSTEQNRIFTTKYLKWYSEERRIIFENKPFYYLLNKKVSIFSNSLPKLTSTVEESVIIKLRKGKSIAMLQSNLKTNNVVYYTRKVSFFLQFMDFVPIVKDNQDEIREPSELKTLYFSSQHLKNIVLASLSSSLFYWYYIINSDCRNLNKREIVNFCIPDISENYSSELGNRLEELMSDYMKNSTYRTVSYVGKGDITVQYFNFRMSKSKIDMIDSFLASHYGFTQEELDFIINYDIKYRMGKELNEEEI